MSQGHPEARVLSIHWASPCDVCATRWLEWSLQIDFLTFFFKLDTRACTMQRLLQYGRTIELMWYLQIQWDENKGSYYVELHIIGKIPAPPEALQGKWFIYPPELGLCYRLRSPTTPPARPEKTGNLVKALVDGTAELYSLFKSSATLIIEVNCAMQI